MTYVPAAMEMSALWMQVSFAQSRTMLLLPTNPSQKYLLAGTQAG
jgi:hypothetical protein